MKKEGEHMSDPRYNLLGKFGEKRIDRLINELNELKSEIKKAQFDKEIKDIRSLLWYKKQFIRMKKELKLVRWPPKLACPYCHACFSIDDASCEKVKSD